MAEINDTTAEFLRLLNNIPADVDVVGRPARARSDYDDSDTKSSRRSSSRQTPDYGSGFLSTDRALDDINKTLGNILAVLEGNRDESKEKALQEDEARRERDEAEKERFEKLLAALTGERRNQDKQTTGSSKTTDKTDHSLIAAAIEAALGGTKKVLKSLVSKFGSAISFVTRQGRSFLRVITSMGPRLVALSESIAATVKDTLSKSMTKLGSSLKSLFGRTIPEFGEKLAGAAKVVGSKLVSGSNSLWGRLTGTATREIGEAVPAATNLAKTAAGETAVSGAAKAATSTVVGSILPKIGGAAVSAGFLGYQSYKEAKQKEDSKTLGLGNAANAALNGAILGGTIGSAVPVVGTSAGAAVGATLAAGTSLALQHKLALEEQGKNFLKILSGMSDYASKLKQRVVRDLMPPAYRDMYDAIDREAYRPNSSYNTAAKASPFIVSESLRSGSTDLLKNNQSPLSGEINHERYLAALAMAESGGRSNAQNPRSSATGLWQITAGTLAGINKKHGTHFTLADMKDPKKAYVAERLLHAEEVKVAGNDVGKLAALHVLGQSSDWNKWVKGNANWEAALRSAAKTNAHARDAIRDVDIVRKAYGSGKGLADLNQVASDNTPLAAPVPASPSPITTDRARVIRRQNVKPDHTHKIVDSLNKILASLNDHHKDVMESASTSSQNGIDRSFDWLSVPTSVVPADIQKLLHKRV